MPFMGLPRSTLSPPRCATDSGGNSRSSAARRSAAWIAEACRCGGTSPGVTQEGLAEWVRQIVAALVTRPEDAHVIEHRTGATVALELTVASEDTGRAIGKRGETITALRTLGAAAGGRLGLRVSLPLALAEGDLAEESCG
jgi:predicted RNA-binding protein YlqC (UPF0109 family)